MNDMFSLKDKVAVVTGAASGIGEAIARMFSRAGASVYVLDRDEKGGAAVVKAIEADGGVANPMLPVNVSRESDCGAAARASSPRTAAAMCW